MTTVTCGVHFRMIKSLSEDYMHARCVCWQVSGTLNGAVRSKDGKWWCTVVLQQKHSRPITAPTGKRQMDFCHDLRLRQKLFGWRRCCSCGKIKNRWTDWVQRRKRTRTGRLLAFWVRLVTWTELDFHSRYHTHCEWLDLLPDEHCCINTHTIWKQKHTQVPSITKEASSDQWKLSSGY